MPFDFVLLCHIIPLGWLGVTLFTIPYRVLFLMLPTRNA